MTGFFIIFFVLNKINLNEEPPNNTNSSQEQSQETNIHNQDKNENVSNNESTQNDDSNSSNKGKYWLIGCAPVCGCLVILIILVLAACVIFYESLRLNFIK